MTPAAVSKRVVADRLDLIDSFLREIRSLPLGDQTLFFADRRNLWSAESCLRRSLEALFDVGRHILACVFLEGKVRIFQAVYIAASFLGFYL